jgi:hypothetical protein
MFHKRGSRWIVVGELIQRPASFDSLCAYAPSAVVADLFGVRCPPYRALHARRASPAVRKALIAALRADAYTRTLGPYKFDDPCVSRLDPLWAAAGLVFPDTGWPVWFHKSGDRWRVDYGHRRLPPRAIVLSLATCASYNASEYGA